MGYGSLRASVQDKNHAERFSQAEDAVVSDKVQSQGSVA